MLDTKQSLQTMNTKSFLRTNLNEYFQHDSDRCIGCSECIKAQQRSISYKYPRDMKTKYDETFQNKTSINGKS